jgi:hypothetical protein
VQTTKLSKLPGPALRQTPLHLSAALGLGGLLSWRCAALVLAASCVRGVVRLCFESQRRKTLIALAGTAPPDTVVTQRDGPDGHSMSVRVGGRLRGRPESEDE